MPYKYVVATIWQIPGVTEINCDQVCEELVTRLPLAKILFNVIDNQICISTLLEAESKAEAESNGYVQTYLALNEVLRSQVPEPEVVVTELASQLTSIPDRLVALSTVSHFTKSYG